MKGEKYKGIDLSPTLGGEYFLFNRFSFGAELQFRYSSYKYDSIDNRQIQGEDATRRGMGTYTYFILRYYLF